ncbi:chaperone protein DnaJ [Variibacter gotjawalensis]|uniref:Chaperone protein DnaJ n=1 Tax=Variibacter gotjawalensis TaxID=1333996 RepID=A0A0S3PV72_9BRAD|nr:J domain-containing protein [Variibacter gotjawalensis]NIK50161.1 polyhydroxyalkanoate synthesis regulator phasin [Variibacter gotjawalensis]RZS46157.1 DnaJ-like protein [Variibacter gotjawalensis]BAT59833.1 chaperone protein DnaJ [Variibacter gotjawalensis]
MKFDSPFFDSLRIKREVKPTRPNAPRCGWKGCENEATHKAPKGRDAEGQYWHFCVDHVREYNASYNYFRGMTDGDVQKYQKDSITGHRPTWKMGVNGKPAPDAANPNGPSFTSAVDPLGIFHEMGGAARWQAGQEKAQQREGRMMRNAERKALDQLGLEGDVSREEIKARFKMLVKRHHPDVNQGDTSSEERLREIISAYNYLKSAGFV